MSIQSPALRESPANLLSSRVGGVSSAQSTRPKGIADLFASVLDAQNPRTNHAESARDAQRSQHSDELKQRSSTRASRDDAARSDDTEETDESDSNERDIRDAKNVEGADEGKDSEHANEAHAEAGEVAVHFTATPVTASPVSGEVKADTVPRGVQPQSEPVAITTAQDQSAQPKTQEATKTGTLSKVSEQPPQSSDSRSHERAPQGAPESRQPHVGVDRQAKQAEGAAEIKPEIVDSKPKTSANVNANHDKAAASAADTGREAVQRTQRDTFDQSVVRSTEVTPEQVKEQRDRTVRHAVRGSQERAHIAGEQVRPESDVNKATKQAIDALLNEQAPREADVDKGNNVRSQPANANASADTAATARAGAHSAAPTAQATPNEPISSTWTATSTLAGATAAPTTGSPTLAGEATTQMANTTSGTEWMTRSDHAAGRILRGLSTMINQHGGSMTMRLDPPELGSLRIQMTIQNGSVSASFTPTNAAARSLLEQNMAQLKTALESQGLMVDKLTIHATPTNQTNAHAGHQHGTDGHSTNDQQSQYADAGHGESRGRSEQDSDQRPAQELFDPALLFEMNDEQTFAQHALDDAARRIPA